MLNPYLSEPMERGEAQALFARAGIREVVTGVRPCAGGVTNLNYEVTLESGHCLLLRRYPSRDGAYDAAAAEAMLHPLLRAAGVPVPQLVAAPEGGGDFAIFEWLDGVRLRDAATREPDPARLAGAWTDTGAALRRAHAIDLPDRRDGEFRGGRFVPSSQPWADTFGRDLRRNAATLRGKALIAEADERRIDAIADRAAALVGEYRPSLLHGDAHAANVLVRDGPAGWALAGWIDWERAIVGDPELDLATFDVFTRAQVVATPDAFWSGYGRRPATRPYRFYELGTLCFLASLDHAQALPPGREARRLVTTDLARRLDALGS